MSVRDYNLNITGMRKDWKLVLRRMRGTAAGM